MNRRFMIATGLVVLALACLACPQSRATRRGSAPGDGSFYEVLRKNVVGGKVNYQRLAAVSAPVLRSYLGDLGRADLSASWLDEDDRLAFWLNAYNACVIAGIIERYPKIKSVMDVKDFFTAKRWKVAGELRSLNDIEGKVLSFEDPRVHLVLVCGAQSCPPLQPYAMIGSELQQKLEEISRQVVNDARFVQLDPKAKRLRLTRIMSWYRDDFIRKYGTLETFLIRYLDEPKKSQLAQGGYRFEFMEYDWALNDAGPPPTKRPAR